MMRFLFIIFFFPLFLNAQKVTVPSNMSFADIKLNINESARILIQKDVDRLTQSPKYYEILAEKARTYLPIIDEIFKNQGIPSDFKYLVIQESSITADAVSSSKAVGYWQMKDFTAMEMGLLINNLIDERQSIVASTIGAARYFKKSNENFNNWLNALQSYQMGIGGALRELGEKDFGKKTMTITPKTYWYVRKFLAYKIAFEDVHSKEAKIIVELYEDAKGKSINELSIALDISADIIKNYNKWVLKDQIPNEGINILTIPSGYTPKIQPINEIPKIASVPVPSKPLDDEADLFPRINHSKHLKHKYIIGVNSLPGIIAGGMDNIETLSIKGDLPKRKFIKYNDLKLTDRAADGQVYYFKKKKSKAKTYYHIIRPGENLWSISQKYGIKLKKLKGKNRIVVATHEETKPGRVLWLRHIRPEDTPIEFKTVIQSQERVEKVELTVNVQSDTMDTVGNTVPIPYHREENKISPETNTTITAKDSVENISAIKKQTIEVIKGETLYSIGNTYNVEITDLIKWNNLEIGSPLSVGQLLVIYSQNSLNEYISYYVKEGDTLFQISSKFKVSIEDLMEWNNKTSSNLVLGERILIRKK